MITNISLSQIWTHNFETAGGYTTNASECTDGTFDYFTRTDGSNIGDDPTGQEGSYYFAAADLDAGGCPGIGSAIGRLDFNDIDIIGCSGLSFEILAASPSPFEGWDNSDYVHILYDIDNSGTWTNLLWFEGSGGTNVSTRQDTNFDGTGNGTTLNAAFQNFVAAIAGTGSVIDIRIEFNLNDSGEDFCIDNVRVFGTGCGVPNTIAVNSVSSLSFGVDCTTGDAGTVNITTTDVFTAGNTYTVELSDASGSFASPTAIGSISSTSNGPLDVSYTIPAGTATGNGYRIRVVSSNPAVTSADNGSNITITLSGGPCILEPPHLTSVIINSCNNLCDEGVNELVFGTSGDYSIDVTAANFNFSYTNFPPLNSGDNFTDVLTNNSTATDLLNDQCASSDPYIDANGTTIPPNSSWVLVNNDICVTDALDWAGLCNSGPIYVIYSSDTDWLSGGNFSNTTNDTRPYQTSITTTNGQTFTIDYETDGSQYPDSDGVFASFDEDGGAATSYGDDNCIFQPVVLPIELYSFNGEIINNESYLQWTTLSEYNFSHFELFHATDNSTFTKIGSVSAAGNSMESQNYRFIHNHPFPGINYYNLKAIDIDGSSENHGTIALRATSSFSYYNSSNSSIILNSPLNVEVYNLQGQLILNSIDKTNIPFNKKGVFIIREMKSGETQRLIVY